jgi:methylated-DNA-[protein]-cysteine S-methyltransferase
MHEKLALVFDRLNTPIGEMLIVADGEGNLRYAGWVDREDQMHGSLRMHYGERGYELRPAAATLDAADALAAYFRGDLAAIDQLAVKTGGTGFQREVWVALRTIPCGTTISYAQLAKQIGRPAAMRAVGLANGANPIGVVVPCHRVIGANGKLTGYGGGIERKAWLLRHEAQHNSQDFKLTP